MCDAVEARCFLRLHFLQGGMELAHGYWVTIACTETINLSGELEQLNEILNICVGLVISRSMLISGWREKKQLYFPTALEMRRIGGLWKKKKLVEEQVLCGCTKRIKPHALTSLWCKRKSQCFNVYTRYKEAFKQLPHAVKLTSRFFLTVILGAY